MNEDDELRYVRLNLKWEIKDIMNKVIQQPEFADEITSERLDESQLVDEVSSNSTLMERSLLVYKPVLHADRALTSLEEQRPIPWEHGWRPDRRNLVAWIIGLAIPSVSAWIISTFSLSRGTITASIPLLLIGASLGAVNVLIRHGLPASVWIRLTWELGVLRAWFQRRGEHNDWRRAVRDDLVKPFVREWINGAKEPTREPYLTLRDGSGLLTHSRDSPLVHTSSIDAFRRELSRPDPGAIGIAGPRGAGKTTLIEHALDNAFTPADEPPFLTITASAPARYDAREFILHLYAITCRAVLRTAGPTAEVHAESEDERLWRRLRRRKAARARALEGIRILGISVTAFVAAAAMVTLDNVGLTTDAAQARVTAMISGLLTEPLTYLNPWRWGFLLQISGMLLLGYSIIRPTGLIAKYLTEGLYQIFFGSWRRRIRRYYSLDHQALCTLALHDLRQVRFLQTRTTGWSGKINGGGVFDIGLTRTVAHAERPLTHPEIVDDYRRLLDRVVAVLAPRDISGIIVAIDELDKLADPAQAREFIDEIKGVFGVPHCLFLVSVSEDALTSFHRRGIPVRDAFDSAFTTVVRIEPFTLDEARVWLAKRAIGIPEPFVHLCYCLSGGLPRELRRIATTMYDHHIDTEKDDDLETVASSLVAADLAARLPAFTSTAAQLDDEQDPGTFLTNLAGPTCSDAWWLLKKCETILPRASDGAVTALTRLEWEAASYLYFCATVVEFFTNELQAQSVHTAVKDGSIVALAAARQQMALDPRVTWQLTTQFRQQRQFATIDECPNP